MLKELRVATLALSSKYFVIHACLAVLLLLQPASVFAAPPQKIVFHLIESQNVGLFLASLKVYLEQPNQEKVDIVVVAHGPAVSKLVTLSGRQPAYGEDIKLLQTGGIKFEACAFMMRSMDLSQSSLLPGVKYLPDGGLSRVMELQRKGYTYIHM